MSKAGVLFLMRTFFCLGRVLGLLFLIFTGQAEASRMHRPIGEYVREADLIVVGNTRRAAGRSSDIVVSIREVIKGELRPASTELVLSNRGSWSSGDAYVSVPATNVAILLPKDWREQTRWPVLEAYAKPGEVAVVRTLVEIYRQPGERQQLTALRRMALADDPLLLAQLLADLSNMHDPSNFDFFTDLYDQLAPTNQVKLVEMTARTADPRAVPVLLKALRSPDAKVRGTAAMYLGWWFPGAPGVTEAFEQALQQPNLAQRAARYLSQRRDDPALEQIISPPTDWARAERQWLAGETQATRPTFLAAIEDAKASDYVRRQSALRLIPDATPAEKERIRQALLVQLEADAHGGNYLYIEAAARILRGLQHPDCLEALLAILPRMASTEQRAARTATLAVRELGPEARRKGAARLIENLETAVAKINYSDPAVYLVRMIWLGDEASFARMEKIMPAAWQKSWAALKPLQAVGTAKDEGDLLRQLIAKPEGLPGAAQEWAIFRLGDLKAPGTVKMLTETLIRENNWTLTEITREALSGLGGTDVETEMLALLTHPDRQHVRKEAIEVLFGLQGARAIELARRMLREEDFGLKKPAMMLLGHHGTPDDLALLLPYGDYWKADRTTHYWALSAVAQIRERYHFDVNGPIVKNAKR